MRPAFVRFRLPAFAAAAGAVTLLSACEDRRVKDLDTGMSRDSVISVLSKDAPAGRDSLPNIAAREAYFIGGKNYEVLYFHKEGTKATRDTNWKELTPVVMLQNKMVGKGWEYWDSVSKANKIPLRKHED